MKHFKEGQTVRALDTHNTHREFPEYFPEAGTIGVVIEPFDGEETDFPECKVQWPRGSTSKSDDWYCFEDELEAVEDEGQ